MRNGLQNLQVAARSHAGGQPMTGLNIAGNLANAQSSAVGDCA